MYFICFSRELPVCLAVATVTAPELVLWVIAELWAPSLPLWLIWLGKLLGQSLSESPDLWARISVINPPETIPSGGHHSSENFL